MSPIYREKYRRSNAARQGRASRVGWITLTEAWGRLKSGWVIAIYVLCGLQIFLFVATSVLMAAMGGMFLEKQAGIPIADGEIYPELLVEPAGSPTLVVQAGQSGFQGVYVQNIGELRSRAIVNVYSMTGKDWTLTPSSANLTVEPGETVHVTVVVQAPLSQMATCLYTVQVYDEAEGMDFWGSGSSCVLLALTDDIVLRQGLSVHVPSSVTMTAGQTASYPITLNNTGSMDVVGLFSGAIPSTTMSEGLVAQPEGTLPYDMYEGPKDPMSQPLFPSAKANSTTVSDYELYCSPYGVARTYTVRTWVLGTNVTGGNLTLHVATGETRVVVERGEKYDNVARAFFHFGRGQTQFILVVLITAMAGSAALADDINSKALAVIFSKPLTRTDYLIGKFVAVFSLISIYTVGAMSAAFIACVLLSTISFDFFLSHLWVLGVIVARGLLASLLFTSLVLFFSSITRKRWYASVAVIALMFLSEILSLVIAIIAERDWINMFALHRNLVQVSSVMFGLDPFFDYPWWYSLVLLAGFVSLSLSAVFLRVGRMEMSE